MPGQFANEGSISTPKHWNYQSLHVFEAHSAYWKNLYVRQYIHRRSNLKPNKIKKLAQSECNKEPGRLEVRHLGLHLFEQAASKMSPNLR